METVKIISQTDAKGRLIIDLPTSYKESYIDVVMVLNPVKKKMSQRKYDFSDIAGKLEWSGDSLSIQRSLRDEW